MVKRRNAFLSLEEELFYGSIIKKGRENHLAVSQEDLELAIHSLWEGNKRGVYKIANDVYRLHGGSYDYYTIEDAVSDGAEAFLTYIVTKYDPDKKCKVMTGATSWVKKGVIKRLGVYRNISLKNSADSILKYLRGLAMDYEQLQDKHKGTLEDYILRVRPDYSVKKIAPYLNIFKIEHLDRTCFTDNVKETVKDLTESEQAAKDFSTVDYKILTEEMLSILPLKEREHIVAYFNLNRKNENIKEYAKSLGVIKREYEEYVESLLQKIRVEMERRGVKVCEIF